MPSLGDSSPNRSACLNVACASLLSITPKFECCWCFRMPRCSLWQLEQSLIMERYVWVPTSCFHWRCHNLKCFVHSDCVSHYYCAGEKLILLNLLLAVQFLQRPRALPAFTHLNKLDKETITCEFPETPDGLIYFYCSLFLRVTQLWFFFLIKWCESKAAAWPQEQTPQDVNSSCEYHEHQKGVVLVLLWGITLTLYWGSRLPSQRLAGMVTLHLGLLDLDLLRNVWSSVRFDLARLLHPAKYKVRNFPVWYQMWAPQVKTAGNY